MPSVEEHQHLRNFGRDEKQFVIAEGGSTLDELLSEGVTRS